MYCTYKGGLEKVHSIFDGFTISVRARVLLPINRLELWAGIASGNLGPIPGDDAAVVNAKPKKISVGIARLRGKHNAYPSGMESAGATAVVMKTSAAKRDTFIV